MPDPVATGADTSAPANTLAAGGDPAATGGTPPAGASTPQLGADGKPIASTAGTDPTKAGEGKAADGKPAEVVYEFKAADGMELDKTASDEFKAVAKELGLTAEGAQKAVDVAVKMQQRQLQEHTKTVDAWAEEVRTGKTADGKDLPEHLRVPGGDKLDETLATCKKALALGPPELKQLLNDSGFGNHPAIVKFMHTVGKALSEDRHVTGNGGQPQGDMASRLYPTATPKA